MNQSLITALQYAAGSIQQIDKNVWEQKFCFTPGFVGFAGHFPQKPVLPAIVQIAMIRLLWQNVVGAVDALEVLSAKYMSPILPDECILVRLSLIPSGTGRAKIFINNSDQLRLASVAQVKPLCLEV